ncbi:MAG: excinuclease ABC subunit UvrC [Ruminococcaceae bacterium]|nr:excinuclease ABC subunit UvrC [Oscillospiraceae bacterium]
MDKEKLLNLPEEPGVYLMKDADGTVIYVGKAKILKNRIKQYFTGIQNHTPKVRAMVANIESFEYIITDSEIEALILECNLIKKYKPYYNILLKDDKHYPYIKVTLRDDYPKIFLARKMQKDGSKYFGPYTSSFAVREAINMTCKLFRLPDCNLKMPADMGKKRACLNAHIGQCIAPCEQPITREEYRKMIARACAFLEGDHETVIRQMEEEMLVASDAMEFEKAALIRDKIASIKKIEEKQKIISDRQADEDVIGFYRQEHKTYAVVFFIRRGRLIGRHSTVLHKTGEAEEAQLCSTFIQQFYADEQDIPKMIYTCYEPADAELLSRWLSRKSGRKVLVRCPKRGDKKKLTEMACKNARQNAVDQLLHGSGKNIPKGLLGLQEALGLPAVPGRIEAYDISHTAGTDAVGSMVVFCDGRSARSKYRHFKIKVATGGDDVACMTEVIYRRIKRAQEEGENADTGAFLPLPDVILLDGGKGQLHAVKELLELLDTDIKIFGMVKDDKHKTRALINENDQEIGLLKTSEAFRLLSEIQEEVHRFAVTYHKKLRSKRVTGSVLEEIEGVGDATRKKIMQHFKTISAVRRASEDEMMAVPGISKNTLKNIYNFFHKTS